MRTCLKIPEFPNEEIGTLGQIYTLCAGVCSQTYTLLHESEEKYNKLTLKGLWPEIILLCDEIISKIKDPKSVDFDTHLLTVWENRKADAYDTILENLLIS